MKRRWAFLKEMWEPLPHWDTATRRAWRRHLVWVEIKFWLKMLWLVVSVPLVVVVRSYGEMRRERKATNTTCWNLGCTPGVFVGQDHENCIRCGKEVPVGSDRDRALRRDARASLQRLS